MCEVVYARTRSELKRFFDFSSECGYTKHEAAYIEKYAAPALNPIRTNMREYLMAVSKGRVVGRLLTWKDDIRDVRTGEKCGYFSLCDALSEESSVLFDEMITLQRKWGSCMLRGPVSPDGSGFFNGLCTGNGRDIFCTPKESLNLPEGYGFTTEGIEKGFDVYIPYERIFSKLAEISKTRFNVTVHAMRKGLLSDSLPQSIAEVSEKDIRAMAARQAERIAPFIDRECSFYAVDGRGICSGYALTMKNDLPRVATLITGNGCFTPAVCYALLDAVHGALLEKGIERITAGVIDSNNIRSLRLTDNKWCKPAREYRIYSYTII